MSHHEQPYSNLPHSPDSGSDSLEKNEPRGKQAAQFIRRIRCAVDSFFSSRYHHHWWLGISALTPLLYSALFIVAYLDTLPQRLEKSDVYVYSTYNCSGYTNSTTVFREWTSTCKAGPVAKPLSEHELLSTAKECSMEMTTDVPMSAELGRFSVECERQEGFETETADFSTLEALFIIALVGGIAVVFYYVVLFDAYSDVREIVSDAIAHLESCSSCSLDAEFGSSDHLALVKYQLIKDPLRKHLILHALFAPLFAGLFLVTPNVALMFASSWPIVILPSLLMWIHSIAGLLPIYSLDKKAFALKLTSYSSWRLHDAAAIKAVYDEKRNKQ